MRPQLDVARRASSFDEVQSGLTDENGRSRRADV
jgi:hypothetical protein